jgi:hypothetical protein
MIPKRGTHYVPLQANFAGQTEILGHAPRCFTEDRFCYALNSTAGLIIAAARPGVLSLYGDRLDRLNGGFAQICSMRSTIDRR